MILTTIGCLLIFPTLFFFEIVKPTINYKRKYSVVAKKIYSDVHVYFKRFDLLNSINFFNFFKNSYEFYKADILVFESSLLVFSKHNLLGFKFNWFSFKINFEKDHNTNDMYTVECLSTNMKDRVLEIEFKDYNYKKSIIMGIKTIGLEVQESLKA